MVQIQGELFQLKGRMVAKSCLLLIGRLKDDLEVVVLLTGGLHQQGMTLNSEIVVLVAKIFYCGRIIIT